MPGFLFVRPFGGLRFYLEGIEMLVVQKAELDLLLNELCDRHMRLIAYAKQAHLELKHNIARLFEALSFSKQVQALNILKNTGCIKNTKANLSMLSEAMGTCACEMEHGLSYETDVLEHYGEIEEKFGHLFECAKDAVASSSDLNIGDILVCSQCGFVVVGSTSRECAVCRSTRGYFRVF